MDKLQEKYLSDVQAMDEILSKAKVGTTIPITVNGVSGSTLFCFERVTNPLRLRFLLTYHGVEVGKELTASKILNKWEFKV